MEKIRAGFIGAGGIARSHAFALNSLKYYYNDAPEIECVSVSSASGKSRDSFALRFGFGKAVSPDLFFSDDSIDTVFILGPNNVHCEHIEMAVRMPSIKRIYIEKPLCSTKEEETRISLVASENPTVIMQVGFQFLFMSTIREMLNFWRSGQLGTPIHFDLKYYHGDYLKKSYREKRANRLTPAPDGGAMADLGSHAISLLIAFLGENLTVRSAIGAGRFPDVHPLSDLFSLITLREEETRAAGTISASRISSGTGDTLSLELFAEKGSLRFSTYAPGHFSYYTEDTGTWHKAVTGSSYGKISGFPSGHVPPGWLRSMIHAHYIFLTGNDHDAFIPDVKHALAVQRIIRESAEMLACQPG